MDFNQITLLNTETIDQIKSFSDDDSIIKELFTSFINDSDSLVESISTGSGDLKVDVHTLKGVAGTIGASRLHEICKKLDANLKNGDSSENSMLSQIISESYQELKDHINSTYL